jgi:pantoate kinase
MQSRPHFAPGHITGFFSPRIHEHGEMTGSVGAGVCISQGVSTVIELLETEDITIWINGEEEDAPVSEAVAHRFLQRLEGGGAAIHHTVDIPVRAGLGVSGAAALSLSLCFSEFLPLTRYQCAAVAHEVEVEKKTGLGDVASQLRGGIEIRITEGLYGIVDNIISDELKVLSFSMGEMKTEDILRDPEKMEKIRIEGEKCLEDLLVNPSPENLIVLSKRFSERIGLHDHDVQDVIEALDEVSLSSIAMLGKSVFSFIKAEKIEKALSILESFSGKTLVSDIQKGGAW